jgi:mutator protein MutT
MSEDLKRPIVIVAACALLDSEGAVLIAKRPAGRPLAGLWEFPGGKLEPGETFETCLVRELWEELGVEVEVKGVIQEITHDYPGKTVHLRFFRCRWLRHEPRPLQGADCRWIQVGALDDYEFPEADARILTLLRTDPALWM